MRVIFAALLTLASAHSEVIDRLAVTINNTAIALSEIQLQVRVAALIDGKPVRLGEEVLRAAADRLVEQTLVRREMEIADYVPPPRESAEALLDGLKKGLFQGDDARFRAALTEYAVTEKDLHDQLLWQLTLLRFIELRFRPGVNVTPDDIRDYYQRKFVPEWRKSTASPPPAVGQVRERIAEILQQEHVDSLVDRWLNQARTQLDIRYREEAFRQP